MSPLRCLATTRAFGRNAGRADGLQSYCRDCRRTYLRGHYATNAARYRSFAKARNGRRRALIRKLIQEAKNRPCADCGASFPPFVMDFDHRFPDEKSFNIGRDALAGRCSLNSSSVRSRSATWCARTATGSGRTRECSCWAARIRTWTNGARTRRATVTPRPTGCPAIVSGGSRTAERPRCAPNMAPGTVTRRAEPPARVQTPGGSG